MRRAAPGSPEIGSSLARLPKGIDGDDSPYRVLGHDNRLGQVVRNLVDNAQSFTRPGTQVRVRLRRTRRDVEFRVEDEGPGIRPENLDKIFDRFYTDRPEGYFGKNSGLGLSISKQIVEAHRGRIWAENRYGPQADSAASAQCAAPSSSSAFRPWPPTGSPRMRPDRQTSVMLMPRHLPRHRRHGRLDRGRPGSENPIWLCASSTSPAGESWAARPNPPVSSPTIRSWCVGSGKGFWQVPRKDFED